LGTLKEGRRKKEEGRGKKEEGRRARHGFGHGYTDEFNCVSQFSPSPSRCLLLSLALFMEVGE